MNTSNYILGFGLVVIIFINSCSSTGSSKESKIWPQFRGVNCTGIAEINTKPPIAFNEKNLCWKTDIPIGHSSPCIWGDKIFITGCLPDEKKLEMICILIVIRLSYSGQKRTDFTTYCK